jgi:preprotein translocase subunit SecD
MAGICPAIAFLLVVLTAAPAAAGPLALSVARAYVVTEEATGRPALSLTLSPESTKSFADFTNAHVGRQVDLRIDGKTVMAPTIRDPILKGEVAVSGTFTRLELLEAANAIWAGTARLEVEVKGE